MNALAQTWEDRSYKDLFEEAVALEMEQARMGFSSSEDEVSGMSSMMGPPEALPGSYRAEQVRERMTRLVSTCLMVAQSTYEGFAERCRRLPVMRQVLSRTLDPLLHAAWKRRLEQATAADVEAAARARSLQSQLANDTTASWAYEGLAVSMKGEGA